MYRECGEIRNLQQTVKVNLDEINRLEEMREVLGTTIKSNRLMIAAVEEERDKFRQDARIPQAAKAAQVDRCKEAFEKANDGLKKQNEIVQPRTSGWSELAEEERNEMVTRYNKLNRYKGIGNDYREAARHVHEPRRPGPGRQQEARGRGAPLSLPMSPSRLLPLGVALSFRSLLLHPNATGTTTGPESSRSAPPVRETGWPGARPMAGCGCRTNGRWIRWGARGAW